MKILPPHPQCSARKHGDGWAKTRRANHPQCSGRKSVGVGVYLEIKAGWIKIILKDKKNILDEVSFLEERNLSEKLLPTIDRLLKKNKLQSRDIKDFQVVSDLGENYTTFRIAKTVAQSFLFALKEEQKE